MPDVLDHLETELDQARDAIAAAVARYDALTDLRSITLELAETGPIETADDLMDAAIEAGAVTAARVTNALETLNHPGEP